MVRWEICGALIGLVACSRSSAGDVPSAASTSAIAAPTLAPTPSNDGSDPHRPVLSPDDSTFTDTRHGGGWSDRCWNEEHAGKFGWAMAACQRGLDLPDLDAKVKPSLLYNQGLALEGGADKTSAKGYYERSLALRSPSDPGRAEVTAALVRVGGTAPPALAGGPPAAGTCGSTGVRCGAGQKCCRSPNRGSSPYCTTPDDNLICE
jgi:hypothetical protein